jgi:uncharacterized protein YlxW (UPF0749 family)
VASVRGVRIAKSSPKCGFAYPEFSRVREAQEMRRILSIALLGALIVVVGVLAAAYRDASARSDVRADSIRRLTLKVNSLQSRVTALESKTSMLDRRLAALCFHGKVVTDISQNGVQYIYC